MMVLVQNKDSTPLSPCHPARARILLKKGKAKVIATYPFTIKLMYQVKNPVFLPTRAILDVGKTCGLGVVQENRTHNLILCKAEMNTRGEQISDNLKNRRACRAQRRNRRNKKRGCEGEIKIRHRKKKQSLARRELLPPKRPTMPTMRLLSFAFPKKPAATAGLKTAARATRTAAPLQLTSTTRFRWKPWPTARPKSTNRRSANAVPLRARGQNCFSTMA